jgi:hypothetical protein
MGGRRAPTLSAIVGEGLEKQQASFMRAIGQKDPEGIATSAAELVAKSGKLSNILYYASKLTDFVLKESKASRDLSPEERERLARREWSRIKKKEGIKDDPVVTDTIVFAVAKAIGKGRK